MMPIVSITPNNYAERRHHNDAACTGFNGLTDGVDDHVVTQVARLGIEYRSQLTAMKDGISLPVNNFIKYRSRVTSAFQAGVTS